MEKNPTEKTPEEKEGGGISRREFLKNMGLGGGAALLFGLLELENANAAIKREQSEKRPDQQKAEIGPENREIAVDSGKEKEIIESVSLKLATLERAVSERGERFASEHGSVLGLQVGKPYETGLLAWFTKLGMERNIGMEEWTRLEDNDARGKDKFNFRYWRFRFMQEVDGGKYTLGHWTQGEGTVRGKTLQDATYEEPLDPNVEEPLHKLNLALDMLIKEFDRPSPP